MSSVILQIFIFFPFILQNYVIIANVFHNHSEFYNIFNVNISSLNLLSPFNESPLITVDNKGQLIYSLNSSVFNFDLINVRNIDLFQIVDGGYNFKYPNNNRNEYFSINLGIINNENWNNDYYNTLTTFIDIIHNKMLKNRQNNNHLIGNWMFGFTISLSFNNDFSIHNLPYVKASIRDLKRYIHFKEMDKIPFGIRILSPNHDNLSFIDKNIGDYLNCGLIEHMPNYFIINDSPFIIENKFQYNNLCSNISINELNTNLLPYSPRPSRCDCIMSMIKCYANYNNFNYHLNNTLLNHICSIVYCGAINDDPKRGHYGVFSSCNKIQRDSIALNLFYTYNNESDQYCLFNNTGKLIRNINNSNNTKSIDKYMKLYDHDGKKCSEEVLEDWNKYLFGVSKIEGENEEPRNELVYNYDMEFTLSNNAFTLMDYYSLTNFILINIFLIFCLMYL